MQCWDKKRSIPGQLGLSYSFEMQAASGLSFTGHDVVARVM
jgi:hypothetical protein